MDSLLVPAQSSHTQSPNNQGGAPTNAEQGKPVSDITDQQNETQ